MRKKILAGNWKMNLSLSEASVLVSKLVEEEKQHPVNGEIIVFPAFTYLQQISNLIINSEIKTGGQNVSSEHSGAFTGEVSAQMLKDCGAKYVLVGHSERREYFHESNQDLIKKIRNSLDNNLTPVFCFGEKKEDRTSDKHFEIVDKQLEEVLSTFSKNEISRCVLAYEPVWAIGTGLNATPEQAGEMHSFVREWLEQRFDKSLASSIPILYGGSCKPENAKGIFEQQDIDGGLIGGASLTADSFIALKEILFANQPD